MELALHETADALDALAERLDAVRLRDAGAVEECKRIADETEAALRDALGRVEYEREHHFGRGVICPQ